VATAVFVVVCVSLSACVPAARGLLITVRTAEPVEAVMVTLVALVAFQLSVTLCPEGIVLLFAEKIRVGEPELLREDCRQHYYRRKGPKGHKLSFPNRSCGKTSRSSYPRPYFTSGVQMPRR
jgi:hypothetical protein